MDNWWHFAEASHQESILLRTVFNPPHLSLPHFHLPLNLGNVLKHFLSLPTQLTMTISTNDNVQRRQACRKGWSEHRGSDSLGPNTLPTDIRAHFSHLDSITIHSVPGCRRSVKSIDLSILPGFREALPAYFLTSKTLHTPPAMAIRLAALEKKSSHVEGNHIPISYLLCTSLYYSQC